MFAHFWRAAICLPRKGDASHDGFGVTTTCPTPPGCTQKYVRLLRPALAPSAGSSAFALQGGDGQPPLRARQTGAKSKIKTLKGSPPIFTTFHWFLHQCFYWFQQVFTGFHRFIFSPPDLLPPFVGLLPPQPPIFPRPALVLPATLRSAPAPGQAVGSVPLWVCHGGGSLSACLARGDVFVKSMF